MNSKAIQNLQMRYEEVKIQHNKSILLMNDRFNKLYSKIRYLENELNRITGKNRNKSSNSKQQMLRQQNNQRNMNQQQMNHQQMNQQQMNSNQMNSNQMNSNQMNSNQMNSNQINQHTNQQEQQLKNVHMNGTLDDLKADEILKQLSQQNS